MVAATDGAHARSTERFYARLAGVLVLWLLINGVAGNLLLSNIVGSGSFAETAQRIAASQQLYRVGLTSALLETLSSVLLAFAFYATLKPVDSLLAQLALIFNLLDAGLGLVVRAFGFVRFELYVAAQPEAAVNLTRSIGRMMENIGGITFGIGTLLFFYLFFKSRYLPRPLAVLGLVACGVWVVAYVATLVFPEQRASVQYICFPLMAAAEVATGVYLMLYGIRSDGATGAVTA